MAWALNMLGEIARHNRDHDTAECYYERCLGLARESSTEWLVAAVLHNLGYMACYRNEYERARELFGESLSLHEKRLNKKGIGECLAGLARVAVCEGQVERAARLCGASEAMLESIGSRLDLMDREEYERTLSVVREELGDGRYEELIPEGRRMSPEQAAEYATRDRSARRS